LSAGLLQERLSVIPSLFPSTSVFWIQKIVLFLPARVGFPVLQCFLFLRGFSARVSRSSRKSRGWPSGCFATRPSSFCGRVLCLRNARSFPPSHPAGLKKHKSRIGTLQRQFLAETTSSAPVSFEAPRLHGPEQAREPN